ncbi:MAG: hypothetical protein ACOY3P_22725 [Planctomycetota bacterium]
MSADLAHNVAGWEGVRGALSEIRACHSEFSHFCSGLFQQIESLAIELFRRQQQAEADVEHKIRAELAAQQTSGEGAAQISQVIERQQAAWEKSVAELRQQQQSFQQMQDAAQSHLGRLADVARQLSESQRALAERGPVSVALPDDVQSLLRQSAEERSQWTALEQSIDDRLQQFTEQLQAQLAAQSGPAAPPELPTEVRELLERAVAQQDRWQSLDAQLERLVALAGDLSEIRAAAEVVSAQPAIHTNNGEAEAALREQLQEMSQKHAQTERERMELELELEAVRGRAAALTESLADQKRLLAQQQTAWGDFQRMMRLLEGMSDRAASAPQADDAFNEPNVIPVPTKHAADPVLDSVVAQFEMLRKDVARRKAGGA